MENGSGKHAVLKLAIPVLFLLATRLIAVQAEASIEPEDDFTPMLGIVAIIAICLVFVLIGIGIVIALLIAAAVSLLIALGITSSAVLIGLLRRRFSSGLRALHYQIFAFAAMPAGIGILWLGNWLTARDMQPRFIMITGALAGACGGLALAFAFDIIARMLYRKFIASPDSKNITHA